MSACTVKLPDTFPPCSPGPARVSSIQIVQLNSRQLQVTKVIYNYKAKTKKQIVDAIQLDIDMVLTHNPAYKFINSTSHFNETGGIEMKLNFQLK